MPLSQHMTATGGSHSTAGYFFKAETEGEETPSVALNKHTLNSQSMRKRGYWCDPQSTRREKGEMLSKMLYFAKGDSNF